jgi:putative ABC transport system ATP-binding protein
MSAPVVSLRDVARVHGTGATAVQALRGVSLDVAAGELVAVMGPSGSGKSTLLNIAGGLDSPTSGEVLVEGTLLAGLSRAALAAVRRRSVGYVFQELNLIPGLTAAENVALPRELDGVPSRKARAEAMASLTDVAMADLADRFPDELSGGQQQRVAIARALVGPRRLVLADEPTGALDSMTGEDVLRLLRARCDAGAAGVLVTHDARHAAWADRVVFLRDGRVVDDTGARPAVDPLLTGRTPT